MTTGIPASPPSPAPLTLTTLGGASLARESDALLAPGKPLALVTYLALAPGRSATREFLLDLLWADLGHDRARHALRQTLWQLRQVLGEAVITGREELRLGLAIESDRDRFLKAVEDGDPDRAIALYRGEFLPGFMLPGSTEFEHWADIERSRLRAAFIRTAELAARRRLGAGRFREAQEVARRMRDADRLNETGWRLLIESLLAHRDLVQVAVEVESLRLALQSEGREPEPATGSLLAEVRRAQGEAVENGHGDDPGLVAELVGREREFATLLEAWGQATRGQARHVHVEAPAGLGKTRLLADLAHRLKSVGARVVSLRANPGDRSVPYAFAGDLARALGGLAGLAAVSPATADVLVGLSPALSTRFAAARPHSGGEPLRLRTAALAEAVEAIGEEHPLALLIDDVHWLDDDSRHLLGGLLHRLDRVPVMVVTAGRPGMSRPAARDSTLEIALAPLTIVQVRALVASLGRPDDERELDAIVTPLHDASGGSPLLVLETLQLALDRGVLRLSDGVWSVVDPTPLLADLETGNAVRSRLASLEPDAAWVLLVLATAGTPLTSAEVGSAMRTRERVDEQLWHLERKGFVRRSETSWEPAHDEIAGAALESESPARRAAAHGAVGRILLDGANRRLEALLQAARHFAAAGDEHALGLAYRRAVQAARQAGDGRSNLALACVASAGDEKAARRLARGLPLRVRVGLHSNARLAGAAVAAVALAAAVWGGEAQLGLAPDARLVILSRHPGDSLVIDRSSLGIRRHGWRVGRPLRAGRPEAIADSSLTRFSNGVLARGPGGRLAYPAFVDNRYTDDIFVREDGQSHPAFSATGDDDSPSWSPDGRYLVFVTARWTTPDEYNYDLAIGTWPGGQVRRLTASSEHEESPVWSPYGGLIAFVRQPWTLEPRQACWITTDGAATHCIAATGGEVNGIVGWLDEASVLVQVANRGRVQLWRWSLGSDQFDVRYPGAISNVSSSPDGRWVACLCARSADEPPGWVIFPTDDPNAVRPLLVPAGAASVTWDGIGWPRRQLTVRAGRREVALSIGESYAAVASMVNGDGDRVTLPPSVLRWRSRDSSVAAVDPATGRIKAARQGRTVVTVDLGGISADSMVVRVTRDSAVTLLSESWATIDSNRWASFGVPPPHLTTGPGHQPGLNNGGDGSYGSGVFSTEALDGANGLGLEAMVSLPVSRSHWQQQFLGVASSRAFAVDGWDRRSGVPRTDPRAANDQCSFSYPGGEGLSALAWLHFAAGGANRSVAADSTWRAGSWHRVRLQLFPDGTCGGAVDGVARWRSDVKVSLEAPFRLWLTGASVETNLVVGHLEAWRGIRQDIDWHVLDDGAH